MADERNETDEVTAATKRIAALEERLVLQEQRSEELQKGIERMATYQGVLHVLKGS